MIKPGEGITGTIALLTVSVLATSGCATKRYVSSQVDPLNQRLGQFEKQTNDRLAWLNNQQKEDMAQVNQRFTATDQQLAQVAQVARTAQATAAAAQAYEKNMASRSTEEAEIANAANSAVASALNYQLLQKADITFGFDKANLTSESRATLDQIVNKFQSSPRAVVELSGFTDPIGTAEYNLGLSRRRAWAVQRYLVDRNVPLRAIHVVGMGEATRSEELRAEIPADGSKKEQHRQDRRVNIRVYGAGEMAATSGGQ
jgi:outer membrane protein OmpA-like peptidoglycan-associated protein